MAAFLAAALAGCARSGGEAPRAAAIASPSVQSAPVAAPPPSGVMSFVASASMGTSAVVVDPYFGGEVVARLDGEYMSASGRQCRRFTVIPRPAGGTGQIFHACMVEGAWTLAGVY